MSTRITSAADVLVVGAGPAGLSCAIAAANRGLQVELLDAMKPPIDKACGEGLMPDSLSILGRLGFDLNRIFRSIETAPLRGIRFIGDQVSPHHFTTTEAAFPEALGRGIRRTVLHQLLLDRAISLGVRFHWETVVQGISPNTSQTQILTNRQTLRARYLIGADGHQSRIAHWANLTRSSILSRRIGLRQHYAVTPWTSFVEVYWSAFGQAYVTPISSNEVCVAFIAKEKFASPAQALTHFPALARHLVAAHPSGSPRGSITLNRKLHRVTSGNIALIGDASGSVDAVTGEGMALCFRQAAALGFALATDDLPAYQYAHRSIRHLPSLMSRSLLLMDRHPHLRTQAIRTFERNPALFSSLVQIHIGNSPMRFSGFNGVLSTALHLLTS